MKLKWLVLLLVWSTASFAQKTSVNALNNIRFSDKYNWKSFPSADLSTPGAGKVITLPQGLYGINTANLSNRPYSVYISTVGTAELASVTGGTYTQASGGTIIVTTANAHTAGYSVQSSTGGIQEAINDACGIQATVSRNGPCNVIVPPTRPAAGALGAQGYDVYDTIYWQARSAVLSGYGAKLNCRMRGPCLQVGSLTNSNDFPSSTVQGFSFRAPTDLTAQPAFTGVLMDSQVRTSGVVTIHTATAHGFQTGDRVTQMFTDNNNYWGDVPSITVVDPNTYTYTRSGAADIASHTGPGLVALTYVAILDNGQGTTFQDIQYESTFAFGTFNHFFDLWDDENALITHFNNNGIRLTNNVNWSGSFVWSGGNRNLPSISQQLAPVITLNASTITANGSNGATVYNSNGLYINNTVIQGQGLWQAYASNATGGFSGTTIFNIYSEPASVLNPVSPVRTPWPGMGTAGLVAGQHSQAGAPGFSVYGHHAPGGLVPTSGSGSTTYAYFIVAHDTTAATQTSPIPVMYRKQNAAGSQVVSWPRMSNGNNTITYDVLRVPAPNGTIESAAGGFVAPYTGGCGGGAVGTCGSIVTSQAQQSGFIQTFTDDTSIATTNYPTVSLGTWAGNINFLPGDVITQNSTITMEIESNAYGVGLNGTASTALLSCTLYGVSTTGGPSICLSSPTSSNNAVKNQTALILADGGVSGGGMSNSKGRLNFGMITATVGEKRDVITVTDSNFSKTKSTSSYRPSADTNDSAIGVDAGSGASTVGIGLRAPVSVSNYIGSTFDGTSWKEQLTTSLKSFKVPITTNSDFTMTAGVFNIAASTKSVPMQTGSGAPSGANCTINGQQYFRTDGTLGQQVYYCNGAGTWTLQTGGGGSGAWDAISSPGGNQSLNMANFSSTWTGSTALTNPLLTITDTTGDTFTGFLQQITAAGTSTAKGLGVTVAAGGTAGQFQAGATGIAINIPTGQGYIKSDRFVSTSANAATTGCVLCLGTTDSVTYRNSGTASTMNLIQAGNSGPVHVGDTPGVDFAGALTSRSAGQSMSMQPQAASGSGNGGDLTFTTGNGAGTGAPGNIHLLPGSGVANSGGGLIDAGTSGWSVKVTNDAAQPPTVNGPVCLTSSGNAKQCDTGTAAGAIGICMANCTNTGSSTITHTGWAIATFDGAPVTSGHYFSVSTTAGQVTDVGASPNATQEALGVVGSLLSGSNYNVFVFASSPVVSLANVVTTNPASGNVILPTSPTQIPLVAQCNATSSVDCFQVKKPDGTVAFKVDKNGIVTIGTGTGTITATQFLSDSSNIASSAAANKLRLASSDLIAWRNNANTGDVIHGKNNSDYMTFVNSPGLAITQAGASFTTTLTATTPAQNQNLSIPDVGAASDTFTMRDMVQTLTNKKIGDSLSFANLGATPSNPAAGTLKVYSKTDQLCQVTSGGTETCFTAGGGGGSVLSAITAAAGANTISNGDNAQTWNWTLTTASKNAFKFGENAAATNGAGSQYLLNIGTLASSTARPLGVFARGTTNGFFSDNVTGNLTLAGAASFDTSTAGALVVEIPNDGATGTTVNLLCKLTTSNTCIKTTTSDLAGIEGVVIAGAGTSGNAQVARTGVAVCTFSNATTVGDYVGGSGATAGNCLDLGSQPTAGAQVLGRVLTAGGAGTSQSVLLGPVGNIPISGTANQVNTAYASGALTLSTPQDIATSSSPTFSQINSSSSTSSFRSSTNAGDTEFQCGRNAAASVTCTATVHGANQTGTGNNGAGHVKIQGGSNASTGTGAAGNVDLQAGQGTAAANANGYIKLSAAYIKGGTYTTNAVVCFSATNTVSDCSTSQLNPIGTAYSSNGNAAIVAEVGSQVGVLYDATVSPSAGWYACLSSITAGKVTAQAGPCIEGRQVGIIEASGSSVTSGNVTLKFDSPSSGPDFVTLTDGATITWAINSQRVANSTVTLGGNRTINITNPVNGGTYVLKIVQDGTGSRTLALGTGCTWKVSGGGGGAISLSTAASSIDILAFIYDGTSCFANLNKNFN